MKILITGGTGFIGKHLIDSALRENHKVTLLSRKPIEANSKYMNKVDNIVLDMKDIGDLSLSHFDVIINLAATGLSPRIAKWIDLLEINVNSALKLCKKAKEIGARFIQIGSFCEYGTSAYNYQLIPVNAPLQPTFPYAVSKAASYHLTRGFALSENLEFAYLRLFNVYGEGQYEQNIWPALKKSALNNKDFKLTPGEQIRDFISVSEVVRIILKISMLPSSYFMKPLILNIGSGEPKTILEFCEFWWKYWEASGNLLPGSISYRNNEVMRYVPYIEKHLLYG